LVSDLYILRHGQTEWNLEGRLQGRRDSPLTALGRAQAEAQRKLLRVVLSDIPDLPLYVSPQERAMATARIATVGLSVPLFEETRVQEVSVGQWEGRTRASIHAERSAVSGAFETDFDLFLQAPGGEGYNSVHDRCAGFLADLTGPAAVVTHAITSAVLRGVALGLSIDEMAVLPREQGCIYALSGGRETVLAPAPTPL